MFLTWMYWEQNFACFSWGWTRPLHICEKKTQIILVPLHGRKKIQVASSHKPSLFKLHMQLTPPRIQNHSPLGLVKKKFPLWKGICLQKGVVFTCGQYIEAWISKLWICNNLSIFYSEAAIFIAHWDYLMSFSSK